MVKFVQGTINFIYFLWRGEIALWFTYWIVGLFGNFSIFVLPLFFSDSLAGDFSTRHAVHLTISGLYFVFSSVCITRAVGANRRPKTWPF